jgi:hypothetical protein
MDELNQAAAKNLLLALELCEAGLEMQRMNLKREHPTLDDEEISELLTSWLETRPSSHENTPGRPGSLDRFNSPTP